ncbi:MAG: D-arabinono-1,4-lactone oxidase [Fidelibacterota bacterium]
MPDKWTSWNENISHNYEYIYKPETEQEISEIVKKCDKVRMIGTGKSSADIVAGTPSLISYENYDKIISIDEQKLQVTVQPGITLKEMLETLEAAGLAFPALPDIDTITVGGAIATGTHGTAREAHTLSEYIDRLNLVTADGKIEQITRQDKRFNAIKISLGVLGIITEVTFQCIPKKVMNVIERPMKDSVWLKNYRKMLKENDFLRILFLPHTNHGYVITGNYTTPENRIKPKKAPWYHKYRRSFSKFFYGLSVKRPRITSFANKIIYLLFFFNRQQKLGSLYDATVTKSRGSTLELAEWTVAIDKFPDLFLELKSSLNDKSNNAYAHIPMDVRFLTAESGWLSNAYGRDIVTMGCVTRNAENADHYEAFKIVEKIFLKYGGRPHWAKRFDAKEQELAKLYERWEDFIKLREEMDPKGKFLNDYLEKLFTKKL